MINVHIHKTCSKKKMKPSWKVKGSFNRTSWKVSDVRIVRYTWILSLSLSLLTRKIGDVCKKKNMKPLWKVINICAHSRTYSTNFTYTYTFTYTHTFTYTYIKLICLCLCSAPNVKVMQSQTSAGKRPSRLS